MIQVFGIKFVTFAVEFIALAIEFSTFVSAVALEFITLLEISS